jgi:RNA ligase
MTHPARLMPFDELLAGLQARVECGLINEQADGDLRLYCYTKQCVYESVWDEFTMMARGLILDVVKREVVATPFPKFFNVGERGANDNWPALPFETHEKVDGSLIIIWSHNGRWRCATKGSFKSEQALKAQALLDSALSRCFTRLDPGDTLLAEYVGPDNRIVVHYGKSELVALGGYWLSGKELRREQVGMVAAKFGWRAAASYHYDSVTDLIAKMPTLPADQEGFVLRFSNGLRLKVKGDEYRRIHALISRCTPLALWEAMRDETDLGAVRRDLPEEFWLDFDGIVAVLTDRLSEIRIQTSDVAKRFENSSEKQVGLSLSSVPQTVRPFLFPYRRDGHLNSPKARTALFRAVRPTGNVLAGYTPSYALGRAFEEAA